LLILTAAPQQSGVTFVAENRDGVVTNPTITIRHSARSYFRLASLRSIIFLFLVLSAGAPDRAVAQDWPTRTVRVVVPYGPGGIADVFGRLTADRLSKMLGQPFVVESRGGAGGAIGTEYVVRSPSDGYTLYFAGGGQFSVLPLMQKLAYDPLKDLTPVSMVTFNGMALAVNNDLPVHSVREFIDYARANPGKINYGSTGLGSSSHLAAAALAAHEKLDMVVVPYQATPPSILALITGTTQLFFGNISDIVESARGGKVRLLAISSEKRVAQFSDIPTVAETVPGFVMSGWNGYFAPAGTPRSIVDRLSQAIAIVCRDPEVVKIMSSMSVDAVGGTPEQLAAAIQQDLPIYRVAVEAAGLRKQ
jgi:tripartite-type tricarboxylate transporter receptor subunit TctC